MEVQNQSMKKKNDPIFDEVVEVVIQQEYVSTPFLQRNFGVDYYRAQRILKKLEEWGYIEKGKEFTERKVLRHKYIQ